jgi:hypothetical protein
MARAIKNKPYDPEKERTVYDDEYYHNHVKYYQRGIPHFEQFLRDEFKFESIADIGCGTGAFSAPFQTDKKVYGFDFSVGSEGVSFLDPKNYYSADLTVPNSTSVAKGVDIAMSLEVYEHLLPEFEMTYLDNVFGLGSKWVIISCAPPGQWGRHHVNCKSLADVEATVTGRFPQYVVNPDITDRFKKIKLLASFYRKNTLVFERRDV